MSEEKGRTPQAFNVDEPKRAVQKTHNRAPAAFETDVILTPDDQDPFLADSVAEPEIALPRRRRLPLVSIFLSALGVLVSAALAMWIDDLIGSLFARADWLGYAAIGVTALALLALVGIVARELIGLRRLAAVQTLKHRAEKAAQSRKPAEARAVVATLMDLARAMPETANGRAALAATTDEIIDSDGMLRLAELELLAPADRLARAQILAACKRVSIVTAVSPRALVDLGYVIYEAARLIRAIAETYGTRPGRIGMLRLFGDVIAHLAVTGSIAVGDGIVQQLLGHGIASKISARFGEGVINGLMTARIGIAAMDLLRPLPFKAVKRPGVGDFLGDLTGNQGSKPSA
jgi:putative membrane protein